MAIPPPLSSVDSWTLALGHQSSLVPRAFFPHFLTLLSHSSLTSLSRALLCLWYSLAPRLKASYMKYIYLMMHTLPALLQLFAFFFTSLRRSFLDLLACVCLSLAFLSLCFTFLSLFSFLFTLHSSL